jgi:hypothetical protein
LLSSSNKVISNEVCASIGCQRYSTTRIKFSIGFSANFCSQCAADLIRDGLGTNEEIRRIEQLNSQQHKQGKVQSPDFRIVKTDSWSQDRGSEV